MGAGFHGKRKYQALDSSNYYSHAIRVGLYTSGVVVLIGAIFAIVILAGAFPGVASPFSSSSSSNSGGSNLITLDGGYTYDQYCALLGAKVCTGTPPTGITVPQFYGGNIAVGAGRAINKQGNLVISVIGADNEVGYYSSNPLSTGYISVLSRGLHAVLGHGGDGFRYLLSSDNFTRTYDWAGSTRESFTNYGLADLGVSASLTGWTLYQGSGPGAGFASANTNNVLTAVFQGKGSRIDAFFGMDCYNSADHVLGASLDADPTVTLIGGRNPYGCGNGGANLTQGFWKSSTVYQTTNDVHTITLSTAGSTNGELSGVRFTNSIGAIVDNYAKAVHFVNTGNNALIYDWNGGSGWYWGTVTGTPLESTSPTMWSGGNKPATADLLIYAISPYDVQYATSYNTSLNAPLFNQISGDIILPLKTATSNAIDIIVVFPVVDTFAANTYSFQSAAFDSTMLAHWQTFVAQMTTWCNQYHIATVDLGAYFRGYSESGFTNTGNAITNLISLGYVGNKGSLGNAGSDYPIYSDAGHFAVAQLLYPVIMNKLTNNA